MANVEQQIAAGRAKKQAMLKKGVLGLLGVIALGALGALGYQYMSGVTESPQPAQQTEAQPPAPINADTPDRASMQAALNATKQALNEGINDALSNWAPDRVSTLTQRLEEAYNDYGAGEYGRVNASLQHIKSALSTLQQDYRQAYQTPYEQALRAFQSEDILTAAQLNQQALSVNPDFDSALVLEQRIAVSEEVNAMYEQARVGKVENNLRKQQQAYARIVELDSQREDAAAELARIDATLREEKFNQVLQHALTAVDAGSFEQAQGYLDEAKSIRQTDPQMATLQARIDKGVKERGASAAEQKVTMFSRLQEWKTVQMLAKDAIAQYPNNAVIKEALDTANQVLAADTRLKQYLDAPARLADNNIRQRAREAITQVSALSQVSANLGEKIDQLEQLIERENTPLDVTVTSDGKSHLKVLGVGHIGEVARKTIQLKPGKYKLEASRQGYRTKVQELVVQKSAMPIVVHLACTDAI